MVSGFLFLCLCNAAGCQCFSSQIGLDWAGSRVAIVNANLCLAGGFFCIVFPHVSCCKWLVQPCHGLWWSANIRALLTKADRARKGSEVLSRRVREEIEKERER